MVTMRLPDLQRNASTANFLLDKLSNAKNNTHDRIGPFDSIRKFSHSHGGSHD